MSRAGYILTGGQSSRMGRDKALLPYCGETLVERIAREVAAAAGSVKLVGAPERYRHLPLPCLSDSNPGCGPLAGIQTALEDTKSDWNLIVACDMPDLTRTFLATLFEGAEAAPVADVFMPRSPRGLEPLCAVYHVNTRSSIAAALEAGIRKVTEGLAPCRVVFWDVKDEAALRNINRPSDWSE